MPSAQAVDYVQCETIRNLISRNKVQMSEALKVGKFYFKRVKIRERYSYIPKEEKADCVSLLKGWNMAKGLDAVDKEYKECWEFSKTILTEFNEEYKDIEISILNKFKKVEKKAQEDYKEKGCYGF